MINNDVMLVVFQLYSKTVIERPAIAYNPNYKLTDILSYPYSAKILKRLREI